MLATPSRHSSLFSNVLYRSASQFESMSRTMDKPAVILDCGTSWCRAGFSDGTESEQEPAAIFPNILGTPKDETVKSKRTYVIGDTAVARRNELNIKYPVEFGHISNWDGMELMWQALINDKLEIQADEHPFLIVTTGIVPRYNLEKISQIFFEKFNVPSLCFKSSAESSLLASTPGENDGLVVEIGGGACLPVPVVDASALCHHWQRTMFSGRDLTYRLSKMISEGLSSSTSSDTDFGIVNSIKEKFCYCAKNYETECQTFSKQNEVLYSHPKLDQPIRLGEELFKCPESLFKPHLADMEFPGLHEIVFQMIGKFEDEVIQSKLYSNVLLCGGSSFFPGLAPRLQHELELLVTSKGYSNKICVNLSPYEHAAFRGAKMAAALDTFLDVSASNKFYDEYGPPGISNLFKQY